MHLFLLGAADPYSVGYQTGQWLFPAIMLGLMVKCLAIARRPYANKKCVLSLALVLFGWLAASAATIIERGAPSLGFLRGVGALILFGALIAGIVLAIIGLVEVRDKERYRQGRAQAITSLVLCGVVTLAFIAGLAVGIRRGFGAERQVSNQPNANEILTYEDLNFRFRAPGKPWVQMDAKSLNPHATIAFMRNQPQIYTIIIAEKIGVDVELKQLAEIAKANMRSVASSYSVLSESPAKVNRLDGMTMESQARLGNRDILHKYWFCVTNGYCYQIVSWGSIQERDRVLREAAQQWQRFDLIDPHRVAEVSNSAALRNYQSPLFHYKVDFDFRGSRWKTWQDLSRGMPEAEFGALHRNDAGFVVVPIFLMGKTPHPDALAQAFLSLLNVAFPDERLSTRPIVQAAPLTGREFEFERPIGVQPFVYRVRVLHGYGFAYLVGAWAAKDQHELVKGLDTVLSRTEFLLPASEIAKPEAFNLREKERHATVFNQVALHYYKAKDYETAVPYFKMACELVPTNSTYLVNALNTWSVLSQYREALEYLQKQAPSWLDSDKRLRAFEAYFQTQLGQKDLALNSYTKLFASGHRDEGDFSAYLNLLADRKELSRALAEAEQYLKTNDTPSIRIQQAKLLAQNKEPDRAIALLQELRNKMPYDRDGTYTLIQVYVDAGRARDALDLCRRFIEEGNQTAYAYVLKGRSEVELKWYREAKNSFETALKKAPDSLEIKRYLDGISALLGEGQNTLLKDPIAPVPLPAGLVDDSVKALPSPSIKDAGGFYQSVIKAISYQRSNEFKATEYLKIQILDSAGISRFSTIQFPFDPLAENLYVNELKVSDSTGRILASGNVSDYYLIDDTSRVGATHKRILNIPVPGLQPGCTIDLTVTRKDAGTPDSFGFVEHSFSRTVPVLESTLFVRATSNDIRFTSSPKIQPETFQDGLCWRQINPMVYRWEPWQGTVDFLPITWITDASATWRKEVTNYLGTIEDRLRLESDQTGLIERLIKGASTEREKVAVLARFVQTNINYKAIEFGRRARIPQTIPDIVRNKYGDCKDHSLLLQQMLAGVGIRAHLALVNFHSRLQKDLPSLDQFSHMVVYLPEMAGGAFIDCTDKDSDLLQTAPYGLARKEALVLDGNNPRFVSVSDYPPSSGHFSSHRRIHFTNEVDVAVSETLKLSGHHGTAMRSILKQIQPSSRLSFLQNQMNHAGIEMTDVAIENLDNGSAPLVVRLVYAMKRQFQRGGQQLSGQLPALWERRCFAMEPVPNRFSPFEIVFPTLFETTVELAPPAGYKVLSPDQFHRTNSSAFITYSSSADLDADALRIRCQIQQPAGKYPAAQYAASRLAADDALQVFEQNVVLARTGKQTDTTAKAD